MTPNRDILVMFRRFIASEQEMEREVMQLNELLFQTERPDNFAAAHEVLDLNRYKIINNIPAIRKLMRTGKLSAPFIFFSNKN